MMKLHSALRSAYGYYRILNQEIRASKLVKAADYSQHHAARLFKAETGLSPFEYIRHERLLHSARMLRNSRKAGALGYSMQY